MSQEKDKNIKEKGYKKLIVWQKADELAYQIYIESKKFDTVKSFMMEL